MRKKHRCFRCELTAIFNSLFERALMNAELRQKLALLEQLCPGDFAAVKRQGVILATELEPLEFLEQLEAEHRIKPEVRENRGMGFLQ